MHNLSYFTCFSCRKDLSEFVMLSCNHTLCDNCTSTRKQTSPDLISITCRCGLTTHSPNNTSFLTQKTSLNQTRSLLSPKRFKTESGSGFYNEREDEMLPSKDQQSAKDLALELMNEIKFVESKFWRQLNQINRNYIEAVDGLKKSFKLLCEETRERCSSRIMNDPGISISIISSHITKNFKKIESKLVKLNKMLIHFPAKGKHEGKENIIGENQQSTLKRNSAINTSLKKVSKRPSHERRRSGDIVCHYPRNKINFEEIRQDLRQQKRLKKTTLLRKPSQLFYG